MYSKYSVKDLGIGTTTPIKLRLVVDRNRLGSHGVVKKLTEIFLERVARKDHHVILKKEPHQIRKANKENAFRASEDSAKPVTSKSKRVVSQKYPNMLKDKKEKTSDKYFTEFFELFKGSNTISLSENVSYFTPYRMQEQYKDEFEIKLTQETFSPTVERRVGKRDTIDLGSFEMVNISREFGNIFFIVEREMIDLIFVDSANNYIQMAGVRQSKTTKSLIAELSKIKEQKQAIVDKLSQQIAKNSQIIEQPIRSFRSFSLKTIINRQRSIEQLQKRLHKKQEADRSSDAKLDSLALKHQHKRQDLERRLQQIAKRNSNRLKQLKDIEENMLKKIAIDIQRNQARERQLRGQYDRLRKEEGKLREVHKVQRKEANQQWRVLQSQKYKVQLLAFQNQKRQNKLIQDRSPVPIKREQKKKQEDKYIPTEKQYKKLKSVDKKDRKQVGNQYLQQVKLLHRQAIVSNKKKKLMNLNLKVVNYSQPIMERIFRNTSDLSKVDKQKAPPGQVQLQQSQPPKDYIQTVIPLSPVSAKGNLVSEDLQTQRYLKQIKLNLLELQKLNREKQTEQNKSDSCNRERDLLIVPTTINYS